MTFASTQNILVQIRKIALPLQAYEAESLCLADIPCQAGLGEECLVGQGPLQGTTYTAILDSLA